MRNFNILAKLCFTAIILLGLTGCFKHKYTIEWKSVPTEEVELASSNLKVYIESSGSMRGYLAPGSEFKDDVFSYISDLQGLTRTTYLAYINSIVVPFNGKPFDFVMNLKTGNGQSSATDVDALLNRVIAANHKNDISVFISDCALGLPMGPSTDYLRTTQTQVKTTFLSRLNNDPDFGVEVYCLKSKFNGGYFQYGQKPRHISINDRPYYIWVFGSQRLLGEVNRKIAQSSFRNGILHHTAFSSCTKMPFTLTFESGLVPATPGKMKIKTKGRTNRLFFGAKVDLSKSLQTNGFVSNPANYAFDSKNFKVEAVKSTAGGKDGAYTHFILVSCSKNIDTRAENMRLKCNVLPAWVDQMNDSRGGSYNKTLGIKCLLGGVAEAYGYKFKQPEGFSFTVKK